MKQHIVHDPTSVQYADGLQQVWTDWEPALRAAESLLRTGPEFLTDEDAIEHLRRVQYKAHTACEFASGLRPPLAAVDHHDYLVSALQACRDTLGVLAIRSDLHEIDEQSIEVGLHSLRATHEGFQGARNSTVAAYHFSESMEPIYVQPIGNHEPRAMNALLWGLIAVCAVLFTVLLFEIFLLTPAS